jgi:hypothetical protein
MLEDPTPAEDQQPATPPAAPPPREPTPSTEVDLTKSLPLARPTRENDGSS